GFGEHLEDLRVRTHVGGRCFAVGYTATQGRQRFVHPMKRIGCRYLQLHFHGRVRLHYAGLIPTLYPVTETGRLQLGDRLHQRIYRTCLDTLRLCMHEHYEDCPWREQALYAMDSHHQMLYGYYAFGEKDFAQSSLRLLALGQREDGLLELCAPAEVSITIPSFSLHFVIAVWEHLMFCGDRVFAEEMMPAVRRILEAFAQRTERCGLVKRFDGAQYWNFYEWSPGLSGTLHADEPEKVFDLPLNALYSMALDAASQLAKELRDVEAARDYRRLRENVNFVINECFWDRAARLYCTCWDGQRAYGFAELSQALAVCCGAADEAKKPSVLAALAERNGALTPVTLACSIYRYDALMTRAETYSRQVFDEVAEIWGGMLFRGATSFWETEIGAADFDDAGSLCHGWSAVPVYLYYRYGLGVWPVGADFAGYRFAAVDCGFGVSGEFRAGRRKFVCTPDENGVQQVKMIYKR
ncbi:MAG: hypothetical protein IJC25_04920, partial [Clostridia bacterium]|nr:hypothetical protein [Clostridia bacterium]